TSPAPAGLSLPPSRVVPHAVPAAPSPFPAPPLPGVSVHRAIFPNFPCQGFLTLSVLHERQRAAEDVGRRLKYELQNMVLMTEQADRPLTPLSAPEQLFSKDSRGNRSTSEVEHGGERRQRRRGGSPADLHLCPDTESEPSECRKKPAGMRLKPVEQLSPMLSPSDCETKFERKKSQSSHLSKTNAQYHKLFKEVSKDELLKQSKFQILFFHGKQRQFEPECEGLCVPTGYTCALQRDILYQGKMFVSDNWICFHSKVFGRDTKISIPVTSVTFIKKTKTALLVPNALVIETTSYQVDKMCNSPVASSCENSFRVKCPSSLPLDFSGDFSDLDGVVQQRRQEMMESSSSGSQTPDYDKITGSTNPTRGVTLKDSKSSQPMSLHAILLIYLFLVSVLVMSSCYMAFKIVALEHRLNSLVSMGEHIRNENSVSHKPQNEANPEIYGELSTNLFKLEKVCPILMTKYYQNVKEKI
ncbi:hypothetical protein L3Q82_012439, partial [Scortum barcoo]